MLAGAVLAGAVLAGAGSGPGWAGTVWSLIWDPFPEAKMEVDLGAIFGGPNHLFSSSASFSNCVHLQVRIGLGLGLDWARNVGLDWALGGSLVSKQMSPNEREKGE